MGKEAVRLLKYAMLVNNGWCHISKPVSRSTRNALKTLEGHGLIRINDEGTAYHAVFGGLDPDTNG